MMWGTPWPDLTISTNMTTAAFGRIVKCHTISKVMSQYWLPAQFYCHLIKFYPQNLLHTKQTKKYVVWERWRGMRLNTTAVFLYIILKERGLISRGTVSISHYQFCLMDRIRLLGGQCENVSKIFVKIFLKDFSVFTMLHLFNERWIAAWMTLPTIMPQGRHGRAQSIENISPWRLSDK